MGGRNKGGNFLLLKEAIKKNVRSVIVIGESTSEITASLGKHCKIYEATSLEDATAKAQKETKAGDSVLFSPACSSFDMFNNYEHRGEIFRNSVRLLKAKIIG